MAVKTVVFGVMGLVVGLALYHWYLVYRLVYNRENNLDLEHGIEHNRIYKVVLKRILNYYRTKYVKDGEG
ncbi:MAG: hypothetical protein EP332_03520 [Bacteroidetes bacterium]|nr:MAG: hypothetical protein EP332_03520 [Bacteroidota bacterium]